MTLTADHAEPAEAQQRPRARLLSPQHLTLAAVVVVAILIRWFLVDIQSGDYRGFVDPWYRHLAENGGFAALKDNFSNYNTPYLVLLAALTYLPVPQLVAIKGLSVVFDFQLAFFVYQIVRQVRPAAIWAPVIAFSAAILLPTVVMNGSAWAQCDSIYAACCLASLYLLMRRRTWLACAMFGLAFAFKLQAVFFLPVLFVVILINRHRLRALLAIPAAFFAALLPALIAGRGLLSQLAVYPAQITNSSGAVATGGGGWREGFRGGGGGGGLPGGNPGGTGGRFSLTQGYSYTYNAPTPYAWLGDQASIVWKYAGLGVAVAVTLGFGIWLISRRRRLGAGDILLVAATATLLVPVLLPEMHERYFYLAEVLTVAAIFVDRRFIAVAAGIQVASISTYVAYLTNSQTIPLRLAAVFATAAAFGAAVILVTRLTRAAKGDEHPLPTAGAEHPARFRQGRAAESLHAADQARRDPDSARGDPFPQRQA